MKVAVIGAGSWGTAVAAIATRSAATTLWARRAEVASAIDELRQNPEYLPGVDLPAGLKATADLANAVDGADVVVMGVPSHGFRAVLEEAVASGALGPLVPVISLAKGIEQGSRLRMTQVVAEVAGSERPVGVLSGPNLAREVVAGQPSASVIALADDDAAEALQRVLMTDTLRIYTNRDVVGCEVAGATKNVIAIAAGIAHGLGYGDNTKAALITRGLAEVTRLGVALGGHPLTFQGLAGVGDLVATCMSPHSRNRTVGEQLGRGRALDDIVGEMRMVAEGVKSTPAVLALADQAGIEMPIAAQVGAVLAGERQPEAIVPALMQREAKAELHGIRDARN